MKYNLAGSFRPIIKTTLLLGSLFSVEQALATGTAAGTEIKNTATVSYSTGGSSTSATSNQVVIKVQELINASLVVQHTGDVVVNSPDSEAPIKFVLTNTGNGNESFTLGQTNVSGSDDFDVTLGNFYVDDGDGIFEPGTEDALYAGAALAADASVTVWAVSAIPDSLADNATGDVVIKALSTTFQNANQTNPQPGDVVSGQGDGGTDAVSGAPGAQQQQTVTYRVSAIAVAVTKAVTASRDLLGQGGSQYVPGAEVDYRITVSVTGTGTATDVSVSDPLPSELLLKDTTNGTITVGGVVMSAKAKAIDGDDAYYDANNNTISVDLGDMNSGDSVNIDFTTVIQ